MYIQYISLDEVDIVSVTEVTTWCSSTTVKSNLIVVSSTNKMSVIVFNFQCSRGAANWAVVVPTDYYISKTCNCLFSTGYL